MGKYAIPGGITLVVLVLLGVLAYTFLEIRPKTKYVPPSAEAQSNEYLALDRWLKNAGYKVRVENRGHINMIKDAAEKIVFIQASLFNWRDDSWDELSPWVAEGRNLIISLDESWYNRQITGIEMVMNALGVTEDQSSDRGYYHEKFEPDFDDDVAFAMAELPEEISGALNVMTDNRGIIRLVKRGIGRGTVTIMGNPRLFKSGGLGKEPNAALAWNLLAPVGFQPEDFQDGKGILFIRGRKIVENVFGRLADRGNFTPLIVSGIMLIIIGFWTVIPLFGRAARDDEKPGRPIRERFLAESRFLSKYRALGSYAAIYTGEIFKRLRTRENIYDDDALRRRFVELWEESAAGPLPRSGNAGISAGSVLDAAGKISRRNFVKTVNTLETILEKL
ncbi:hypothetical protein AGMMS49928_16900 [Spirochaetia bacterium]|nr:hypothetical protein AGMMS49928_16900 [Spirochaetia bacterium]